MLLLDIIITHHKEPWSECRKMFEMLRLQRGVKDGEFRVILVQDGEDEKLDLGRITRVFPFVQMIISIPQSGVSAARNEGLAMASAPWVMFCDCDDCFYAVDSLWRVLESIREAGDRADLLRSDFWIEMHTQPWSRRLKERNTVFNHGNVYRRAFLEEKGLRFDEELDYSEDALFNSMVWTYADRKRIAKMPEPVYMWCYRDGSLSNYAGGTARRNLSLWKKKVRLCQALEDAGEEYEANCSAARTLLDMYWELNGQDEMPGGTREEWIQRIQSEILSRWPDAMKTPNDRDLEELYRVAAEEAALKRLKRPEAPDITTWLMEIGAIEK